MEQRASKGHQMNKELPSRPRDGLGPELFSHRLKTHFLKALSWPCFPLQIPLLAILPPHLSRLDSVSCERELPSHCGSFRKVTRETRANSGCRFPASWLKRLL